MVFFIIYVVKYIYTLWQYIYDIYTKHNFNW